MILSDKTFDNEFKKILKWIPWIGMEYTSNIGKRLLIVGESHYIWSNDNDVVSSINNEGFTRNIIHEKGLNSKKEHKDPILRNTERALFNAKIVQKKDRKMLWRSVSFYNFIQKPMNSRKHRPSKQDWQHGWNSFFNVLDILRPDYVLFCGLEATNKEQFFREALNNNNYTCSEKIGIGDKFGRTNFRTKGTITKGTDYRVSIFVMGHPSSFFSWKSWGNTIGRQMSEYIFWLKGSAERGEK